MTMQFPVPDPSRVNEPLFDGPADWISPGSGAEPGAAEAPAGNWLEDPPVNDGRTVVLSDTDHYAAGRGDALWAWKSFLRGHNPILYDLGIVTGAHPSDPPAESPGAPPYAAFEPARYALGDTLRYAQAVHLAEMPPRGDLSSTGYALANPGEEFLVLQPSEAGDAFSLTLKAGAYAVEWYGVTSRQAQGGGTLTVESDGSVDFTPPFAQPGPVVLYLRRITPQPVPAAGRHEGGPSSAPSR